MTVFSQNIITGNVSDASSNLELIGVTVIVKNTKPAIGTVTDYDGNYIIKAKPSDTLEFSYIGYATMDVAVAGRNKINVNLSEKTQEIEELVIIGYGAVQKEDLTGVVAKVGEEEFNRGVVNSPENLLTGKVAGVQISNNGEPGGGSRIKIRGGTSLDGNDNPLFVVDGVPVDTDGTTGTGNPLNFLNPSDIADITVLKDASAAAIYGSRGAKGVVIITTKSGSGKPKLSYNGFVSLSQLGRNPRVFDSDVYRTVVVDKAPQNERFLGDASTDWINEVTRNPINHKHNLTYSGSTANNKLNYYLSGGYQTTNGIIKTSKFDIASFAGKFSTKLFNDNLELTGNTKNSWTNTRFAPQVMNAARIFDPTQPVLDEENTIHGGYFQWDDALAVNNPVSTLLLTEDNNQAFRTLNSLNAKYHLPWVEGLSFSMNGSIDQTQGDKVLLRLPTLKDGENAERNGYLELGSGAINTQLLESFFTYKKSFDKINHKLTFTAGHSWQNTRRETFTRFENQLEEDDSEIGYDWTLAPKRDSSDITNRIISFYGRVNYNIQEKYLVTASLRRDGSTRFGNANKWGLFPSAAIAWRILQEDWTHGLENTFSDLKLRVSYGSVGNEDINDFLYTTYYYYGTFDAQYQFGDEYIRTLRGTGVDPNIKWEATNSLNIGVDFGFMQNRISGSVEVYQKNTTDLLYTVAAPAFTNLKDRILTNIGSLQNRGIELGINAVVLDRDDFDWNLNFNIAHNRNKITKLSLDDDPDFFGYETGGISGDVGQTIQVLRLNESVSSFLTYKHIRDAKGNPLADNTDWNEDGKSNLLDIYEDFNNDGIINENDLYIPDSADPDFVFGITSNMNYKKWDVSLTLRGNIGGKVYNNVASSTGYYQFITDRNRVNNNIDPSSYDYDFTTRQLKSDIYIENADFVKLDNITIGYNVNPPNFMSSLKLYLTVQNIFTLTNYSGLDPEIPLSVGGIDNNVYPITRAFIIGLNTSF